MNMLGFVKSLPSLHTAMPILSFPSATLIGKSVYDLTHDAAVQAEGIVRVAKEVDSAVAVTMMDLSLEAEAFGANVVTSDDEVPTVIGALLSAEEDGVEGAEALVIPDVREGRTKVFLDAAILAKKEITDKPLFAGMIGPFSLAGRLMDVSEALMNCLCEEEFVHAVLKKTTAFLIDYAKAYKEAGLDGILMAEPLSGLLSPDLEAEFSGVYVKEIVDAVQDEHFVVIYHNCGPNTPMMVESLVANGSAAYHFGDAVDLVTLLEKMPTDIPVCGNISPSVEFLNGTPESIYSATVDLVNRCKGYRNFVLSSGCDIPPAAPWENIRAFFKACDEAPWEDNA